MTQARPIVEAVVRQHVENAAFFWAQRDTLAAEDPPDTEAIAFVDGRLEAELDALRIADKAAWPFIIDAFETYPEKGELFVTAVHAIETRDAKRIEQAVAFARVADQGARGLCGAFQWLPPRVTAPLVRDWIDRSDPIRIEAALSALLAHGGHPRDRLEGFLGHDAPGVRRKAEAFRPQA